MNILFVIIIVVILIILLVFNNPNSQFTITNNTNTDFYIVSFSHNCCKEAQKHLEENGMKFGAKKVFSLNLNTLEAPEDVKNVIKNNNRGAGFWCWKPYSMEQISKIVPEDSIIMYMDSGTFFTKKTNTIINFINENNVLIFKHVGLPNLVWSKMNAVKKLYPNNYSDWCKGTDAQKEQLVASFVGVKNNSIGKKIIAEWKQLMSPQNLSLYDDSPSNIPNCDGYIESRHDQHMLSLMMYKNYPNLVNKFPYENNDSFGWIRHQPINGKGRHE